MDGKNGATGGDLGHLAQLLHGLPLPAFVVDHQGSFLLINNANLAMIGSPSREVSGQFNAFTLPTFVATGVDAKIRRCLTGETLDTELDYLSMFSRPIFLRLHLVPLRDKAGQVTAAVGMVEPLNQRKELEQRVEQLERERDEARRDLERLRAARLRFAAITSHELRTPLVPLMGYLKMLNEDALGPLTRRQRRAVRSSEKSAWRLFELVDKMLTLSAGNDQGQLDRGDQGGGQLQPVDLSEVLSDVLETMDGLLGHRDLHVSSEIAPDLPPVLGVDNRLSQLMMVLLENASKFVDPGGRLRVSAFALDSHRVAVEVANTGKRIPAEERERIFELFYQAEQPETRTHSGMGIGLGIARQIVQRHGGQIGVVEREGFDVAFQVQLRRADAGEAHPEQAHLRVLVVGVDPERRKRLVDLVKRGGGVPHELDLGDDLTQAIDGWQPDAAVVACSSAEGGAIEWLRNARGGLLPLRPILFVVDVQDERFRREILDAGATAVVGDDRSQELLQLLKSVQLPAD
jgi:PAS domain S-box-containing protein